jgi:hypothetical protein
MSDMSDNPVSPIEPVEPAPKARSPLPLVLGIAAVVALVIGVVIVARDGGTSGGDAATLLSAAPDAAAEAGRARLTFTASMEGEGMTFELDGEGVEDFRTGELSMTMSMMGVELEQRIVDGIVYQRLPEIARPGGLDTEWYGIAQPAMAGGAASPFGSMQGGAGFLNALRGMGHEVTELGDDEIDGEAVTGYEVVIDMGAAIEQLPADQRDDLEPALEGMRAMGMGDLPMTVWLNDDGLPARVIADLDLGIGTMTMQIDYADFGTDAVIEAPPAERVRIFESMQELQEVLGSSTGFGTAVEPAS